MKLDISTLATSRPHRLLCVASTLLLAVVGCSTNNNTAKARAFPTVTWATPTPLAQYVPLSSLQLDAVVYNNTGTFTYTPALGTVLPVGSNTLSVTFTPTDTTNFQPVTQQVNLIVEPTDYTYNNVQIVAGGFIDGIIAHPTTQNLFYLRTDIGGAYKYVPAATTGATGTWQQLLDFLPASQDNYLGVESIAIDPTNPQKLYLAVGTYTSAGNGAFLISNNQGTTFTTVAAPFPMGSNNNGRNAGERLAVDPNLPSTLYFGSRLNGLWKSTNSGTSWSQVTSFPVTNATPTNGVGVVFVDFVKASGTTGTATPVIYVGVSDSGANYATLYRSTDGGNTWAAVPGAPAGVTGQYVNHGTLGPDSAANSTAIYLSYANAVGPSNATSGALYKYTLPANTSPTGAGTWTNISVPSGTARPATAGGGYGNIIIDPEVPGTLMASTLDDYTYSGTAFTGDDIYRSTNYGATWVSLSAQGKTNNAGLSPWLAFGGSSTTNVGTGNWPVAMVIDPFNSNNFMYGTGQTLWSSTNVTTSDSGNGPSFSVGATGIEECAVYSIAAPPAGGYLISGVYDIGGFVHTSITTSPTGGMSANPILTGTTSVDFAQAAPLNVVRVGSHSNSSQVTAPPFGAVSTTGGQTSTSWTPFATSPAGSTVGQGTVAIAADGSTIVWATADAPVAYSTNSGTTWTASTGAIAQGHVYSDRVNPQKFYILSGTTLQISTDGGHTFTNANTSIPAHSQLTLSFAAEGDLWLATPTGLLQSTNSGTTFNTISGFTSTSNVGFGKTAPGATYPAIYVVGTGASGYGFYRSVNGGANWVQVNNSTQLYANITQIIGDQQVFGRFYLATNGRGIPYGASPY